MLLLALAALSIGAAFGLSPTVQTQSGTIEGSTSEYGFSWKGIPYASPPVGTLRWALPIPAEPWSGVKLTQEFGAGCPQICGLPAPTCPTVMSEDCLTMNIFAPANANALPVMVFIHGGAYSEGLSGIPLYDGGEMANVTNTVIVTFNYRLSVLGFLVANGSVPTNLAIRDQQLALQWVNQNIHQFGGNSSRVTLFGQSAGAASVAIHLLLSSSWSYFHQAILESNPSSLPMDSLQVASNKGLQFGALAGCDDLDLLCLQSLSVDEILKAMSIASDIPTKRISEIFLPYSPVVDNELIYGQLVDMFAQGVFHQVPVILGDVSDEGRMFIFQILSKPCPRVECNALIIALFGKDAQQVLDFYPYQNETEDCRLVVDQIFSDYAFTCPNRNIATSISNFSSSPLYRYWFNHAFQEIGAWGPNYTFCEGHVCHCEELPFVFGTALSFGYAPAPDEVVLQQTIQSYWGQFAWTGNPNVAHQPAWPVFAANESEWLSMITPLSAVQADVRSSACDFWDTLGYNF